MPATSLTRVFVAVVTGVLIGTLSVYLLYKLRHDEIGVVHRPAKPVLQLESVFLKLDELSWVFVREENGKAVIIFYDLVGGISPPFSPADDSQSQIFEPLIKPRMQIQLDGAVSAAVLGDAMHWLGKNGVEVIYFGNRALGLSASPSSQNAERRNGEK